MNIHERVTALDWNNLTENIDRDGYAQTGKLLSSVECDSLTGLYDDSPESFRSTIDMSRYNFGSGQYKYFSYPLPGIVQKLRESLYPPLSQVANQWAKKLGTDVRWPILHDTFIKQCHQNLQCRPTPLLLSYKAHDYNCLHQDLYGDVYFPLQVVVMLSDAESEFTGGEFVLVENRPRLQSRASVLTPMQGCAVIIPVRERPRNGSRGYYRAQTRHGVSELRSGRRRTLGIIFHDAE